MTATPAPDVTDRTDATDSEFADRLRAFDGEAAPESFDATVERVAIALWRCETEDEFPDVDLDRLWPKVVSHFPTDAAAYRRLAAAVIAALAPQPADTDLARRLRDVADNLDYYASKTTGGSTADGYTEAADRIRDALAGVNE